MSRMIDLILIPPMALWGLYLIYRGFKAGPVPGQDAKRRRQPKIGQ